MATANGPDYRSLKTAVVHVSLEDQQQLHDFVRKQNVYIRDGWLPQRNGHAAHAPKPETNGPEERDLNKTNVLETDQKEEQEMIADKQQDNGDDDDGNVSDEEQEVEAPPPVRRLKIFIDS